MLAELAARDGVELAPWDWAFYSERVRAEQYDVDTAALRPYFDLERVLHDGVFFAAARLYGIEMVPRAPTSSAITRTSGSGRCADADGTPIGLFLGDYFAREGKRGGAWMSNFVDQSFLFGSAPVVFNVLNLPRPAAGEPALLELDEVRTLFHEFGHALHGLFSQVTYPRLSGTDVPRDFVEYPSQVNEMWILWPEVLENYARHVDTGEPLPPSGRRGDPGRRTVGRGFRHHRVSRRDPAGSGLAPDPAGHRRSAMSPNSSGRPCAAAGIAHHVDPAALPEHLLPAHLRRRLLGRLLLLHLVGGAGRGDRRVVQGERRAAPGERRRCSASKLLSVGGSVDSMAAFRSVRGRDADIGPLLRRRGLDRSA